MGRVLLAQGPLKDAFPCRLWPAIPHFLLHLYDSGSIRAHEVEKDSPNSGMGDAGSFPTEGAYQSGRVVGVVELQRDLSSGMSVVA